MSPPNQPSAPPIQAGGGRSCRRWSITIFSGHGSSSSVTAMPPTPTIAIVMAFQWGRSRLVTLSTTLGAGT